MSWPIAQLAQLFKLAEAGELGTDALERAARVAPLRPSREDWLLAGDRLFAFAGTILLAAAIIFFFAWNWPELHRFAKLGIALAALASCVGAALFSVPFGTVYRAALLGACAITGAVLALVGQTYQTGADVWELFAAWALLMLPFALFARSSASWLLWLLVVNLAVTRALWHHVAWFPFLATGAAPFLLVAASNLVVLLLFEFAGGWLLAAPRRYAQRLAALGTLAPLAAGGLIGWWEPQYSAATAAFFVVAGIALFAYYRVRRDLPILATVLFSGIAVLTGGLIRLLPHTEWGFFLYNGVAVFVLAGSALAGKWLVGLHREGRAG
jgi:uncharacterized membrane protein